MDCRVKTGNDGLRFMAINQFSVVSQTPSSSHPRFRASEALLFLPRIKRGARSAVRRLGIPPRGGKTARRAPPDGGSGSQALTGFRPL